MSDRRASREEHALADRLRREAMEERPPFSPALHQRLCDAVFASKAPAASARTGRPTPWPVRRALAIAVSVIVLLGVAIASWQATWRGGLPPRGTPSQPGGSMALSPPLDWQGWVSQGLPGGLEDASSGLEMISSLTGRAAEDAIFLMERTVIERLVEHGRWTYLAIDDCVPLNPACALMFGEAIDAP